MCSSSSKIVMTRYSYSPPLCTTSTPPPSFALGLGKHLESCGGRVQDDHNDDQEGDQNNHDDHQNHNTLFQDVELVKMGMTLLSGDQWW